MLLAAGHSWRHEAGFARWTGAFAAVLLLHAGAALGGMIAWDSVTPPAPPPAAIMLELAPVSAAPPAPQLAAPTPPEPPPPPKPPADLAEMLPPLPELPLTPPDIPPPEVTLPQPEPPKKIEEARPEKPKEKPKKKEVEKPKPKPKPNPEPEPIVAEKPALQPAPKQEAAAPAQRSAAPAAPSPADVARHAAAKANWQGILLAHLERHKKYPRLARKRHEEGTAYLRFRMDRSGQVLSFALARSAGYEALDEEVLEMIKRAEPLPALPPEVLESEVEIVVPVQFTLR